MKQTQFEMYPETFIKLFALIQEIAREEGSDRLPSEEALAAQMGVSRVKIRDVLAELEAAGYVIRKRGVGTRINRYILAEKARLDVDSIYVEMVESYGLRPRSTLRRIRFVKEPDPSIAQRLDLQAGEALYLFEKQIYADERPVILVKDYIPAKYYDSANNDLTLMDTNIYFFLQNLCDELLETLTVHMDACVAQGDLAQIMQVPEGYALMKLDSVCYTQASRPIMYAEEYFNTKILPFSFQKRVLSGKFNRNIPPYEVLK